MMLFRTLLLAGLASTVSAVCTSNPTGIANMDDGNTDCANTPDIDTIDEKTCTTPKLCGYCDFACAAGTTSNTHADCKGTVWALPLNSPESSLSCITVPCPLFSSGAGGGADCTCNTNYYGSITWDAAANHYRGDCFLGEEPVCYGSGFNTYFVCDNSGSVGSQMKTSGTDFVERMIHSLWDHPGGLFDIVYFDGQPTDILSPPTDDRSLINASIDVMRGKNSGGSTYMDEGLHPAKLEIEKMICPVQHQVWVNEGAASAGRYNSPRTPADRAACLQEAEDADRAIPISVVFLLSDGATSNMEWAVYEAEDIKAYGGYLFSLGIGSAPDSQLSQIRSSPEGLFRVQVFDYAALSEIADTLLNEFCLDIKDIAYEAHVCMENGVLAYTNTTFAVQGFGFEAIYVEEKDYKCRFIGSGIPPFPGRFIDNFTMECDFDFLDIKNNSDGSYNASYVFDLEISVDGTTWTSTAATIGLFVDPVCPEPIVDGPPPGAEVVAGAVVGGLIFLLCLLWFLWPLLFGVAAAVKKAAPIPASSTVIAAPPKAAPAPVVAAEQPVAAAPGAVATKKWAVVDTSSYVWDTGGGGAGPVHTQWGELGATAAAPTLNAKTTEIDVVVQEQPPAQPAPTPAPEAPAPTPAPAETYAPEGRSCCETVTLKCCVCYAACAAMRPQRAGVSEANEKGVEMDTMKSV